MKSRGPHPIVVTITELQEKILTQIARSTQVSHAYVMRAKIILGACAGKRNAVIARELICDRGTVKIWRGRWSEKQSILAAAEGDVAGSGYRKLVEAALSDEARSGRPNTFTAEQLCQIVAVAVQSPTEYGCPVTHWTPRELAHTVIKEGIVSSISPRHIGRFLKGVRPETASVAILAQ